MRVKLTSVQFARDQGLVLFDLKLYKINYLSVYVNRIGSNKSESCNKLICEIWEWAEKVNI